MAHIKEFFAQNLKEKRRKCGFTQAQLAEKVNVSTHHIAMIEIARNYPTLELVERIAHVLGIEIYELFLVESKPQDAMEKLHDTLVANISKVICQAVQDALKEEHHRR